MKKGTFDLYEDDAASFNYAKGNLASTHISTKKADRSKL
ncbi:DUF5110 domain-containing protein [Larkinella harenae]